MVDSPSNYWIALEKTPECARRIGIVIGLFATIEHELVATFRWIANMLPDHARVAMESHKQFSNKIAYLEAVCATPQPDWERDIEACRQFADAAKIANTIRNKYAHATYGWDGVPGSETLYLSVFADSLGGAARKEVANIAILDNDILYLKSVIVAMTNYRTARAAGAKPDLLEIQRAISKATPRHLRNP
jgi:hypothetical protein